MKLIAHRGNISGPSTRENAVEHIQHALSLGFDAEVDVWYANGWWLGHDNPTYLIDNLHTLFDNTKIWWHCKNFAALERGVVVIKVLAFPFRTANLAISKYS